MNTKKTLARIGAFSKAVVSTFARQQFDFDDIVIGMAYSIPIALILHTIKDIILAH